jgi:DNA-binding phage protein
MGSKEAAAAIMAAIVAKAKVKWGEGWQVEIVRSYCMIETAEASELVKPVYRRKTVLRALELGGAQIDTVIKLAQTVGLKISAETMQEFY